MSCKYNNCKHCGYKSECEIYKENTELNDKLNNLSKVAEVRLANWQKYKEENKKWKDEWQEQVQKANDEGYARTLQTIQLNKAKKIISNLYAICKDNHYPNTSVLMEQAEQFLKECE